MFSGPYSADQQSLAGLDQQVAQLAEIDDWQEMNAYLPGMTYGMRSNNFLYVDEPAENKPVRAPLQWSAVKLNEAPWNRQTYQNWLSDFRLGMATGQSYLAAFYLQAEQATEVRLYVAVEGESKLWIAGQPVSAVSPGCYEPIFTVSPEKTLVVLRVAGRHKPTGFTCKVVDVVRGREAFRQERSGTYSLDIAADRDALNLPPQGLMQWLPARRE